MASHSLEYSPKRLSNNVTIQTPLTRNGKGPGLIILLAKGYEGRSSTDASKTLDPEPQQKWAEEGFVVVEVNFDPSTVAEDIKTGLDALGMLPQYSGENRVGLIGIL